MITNRDILVVGQQPWDTELGSNCKNIAMEFSKNNRVLFINPPLDRITRIRNSKDEKVKKRISIVKKSQKGLVKINDNLWTLYPDEIIESINWIKSHWIFDILNRRNNKIFASCIKGAINELSFKDFILFNDSDMFRSLYLKELVEPQLTVYYSRDYLLATDYYKHHGKKFEPKIIEKSDVCVANSEFLTNYCKQYNVNSYNVGQGCDLSAFNTIDQHTVPIEMLKINGPVIGYVGVLFTSRLDIDILAYIALNNPKWNLVLIGPEDDTFKRSKLHELSNVHFLGAKDLSELPYYIKAFDICINPQLLNELTVGNYPRKVDEYLAMGKPVVATRTDAMKLFENYAYTANTKEEYPVLIERALNEDSEQAQLKRRRFAATHTWTNNVKKIYDAMFKSLKYTTVNS